VYAAFLQLAEGKSEPSVAASEIIQALRETGQPLAAWEVRGELSKLENLGAITLDEATARWKKTASAGESISPTEDKRATS